MSGGGFMNALAFLGNGVAALATFVAFPHVYDWSWGWLLTHVLGGYSAQMQSWAPWVWSGILIWVLFALTKTGFLLLLSLGGIIAIVKLFFRNREDDE
ncbi:hypothetical protein ACOTTU_17005 [Roseobacter sp. EG26]|uniref:hypothetical protein n=1 Tax=Roseobacter sp. EG26 TaxID=3412477 RepID=UPI003CE57150